MSFINTYFSIFLQAVKSYNEEHLIIAKKMLLNIKNINKKVIIIGNGGSSAMASHVSVDLTKVGKIRTINFNESDLITCYANDYGYENWIVKALESYADSGDLLIAISSSGNSKNIINACKFAKDNGMSLITFSGFSSYNPLKKLGDINFWVDSKGYNIIEMTHHIWLLALVDSINEQIEYSAP
jgi:D-sedoheptulose 7-phosphate isomerase